MTCSVRSTLSVVTGDRRDGHSARYEIRTGGEGSPCECVSKRSVWGESRRRGVWTGRYLTRWEIIPSQRRRILKNGVKHRKIQT